MILKSLDISDIPCDQLSSLASVVTSRVWAENTVTHASHLRGILSSVTCSQLWLLGITLSETETRVLVTAMKDQVEAVRLGDVTLDMEEVCLYDGRGRCRDLQLDGDTKAMWGERIRGWSARVGWLVSLDNDTGLVTIKMDKPAMDEAPENPRSGIEKIGNNIERGVRHWAKDRERSIRHRLKKKKRSKSKE